MRLVKVFGADCQGSQLGQRGRRAKAALFNILDLVVRNEVLGDAADGKRERLRRGGQRRRGVWPAEWEARGNRNADARTSSDTNAVHAELCHLPALGREGGDGNTSCIEFGPEEKLMCHPRRPPKAP